MQTRNARPPISLANLRKIARFVLQRAGEKKLTQVASSLTFTSVLSLVPLLAVVLSLFTAFPLFNDFRIALESFFTTSLMPAAVSDTVMLYLNQFAAKASGLTAIGSLFLIVTSVSLFMTIDQTFNNIWQVERQRPLRQRVLVYWALISLGPILIGASLWASTLLARESFGDIDNLPALAGFALSFVPLLATGLGFTALFIAVPNRKVLWKDGLAGGFGTAIVLEIMRIGFAYYLTRFPSYTVIYGAFATLPIFLLWLYMSWLAVLIGATVASILPDLRMRRWALEHFTGGRFVHAMRVLRVLWHAQNGMPRGRSTRFLCAHLQLQQEELTEVLCSLKDLGYVVDTEHADTDQWVLACDQRTATIDPLVNALLLDRTQPGLRDQPLLIDAIAGSLMQPEARLAPFFEEDTVLPESAEMVQNTLNVPSNDTQENNDAQSQ